MLSASIVGPIIHFGSTSVLLAVVVVSSVSDFFEVHPSKTHKVITRQIAKDKSLMKFFFIFYTSLRFKTGHRSIHAFPFFLPYSSVNEIRNRNGGKGYQTDINRSVVISLDLQVVPKRRHQHKNLGIEIVEIFRRRSMLLIGIKHLVIP